MGLFSSFDHHSNNRLTIILNYFGKVSRLKFDKPEVQNDNFFEILLERILQKRPHFQGSLAVYDKLGEKKLIDNTFTLRQAVGKSPHNRLILHTIEDSDMMEQKRINQKQSLQNFLGRRRGFMQRRSTSVPPLSSPYSAVSSQNTALTTALSSMDAISFMERTSTINNKRHSIADDENSRHHHLLPQQLSRNGGTAVVNRMGRKNSDDASLPPPSKGLPFSPHYYGQQALPHLLYGMPPHNLLLAEFLSGGNYMFNPLIMSPLFATRRHAVWMGPNKYLSYGGGRMLAGCAGWEPMW